MFILRVKILIAVILTILNVAAMSHQQLLTDRYCLKAIEHCLLLYNGFNDKNTKKETEKISYDFHFINYFEDEDIKSKINPYTSISDFFSAYSDILGKNDLYNNIKNSIISDDNIEEDTVTEIWFKFIIIAKFIYKNIITILDNKITESNKKRKKSEKEVKLHDSCTYFKKLYQTRTEEYEMILKHFKTIYENEFKKKAPDGGTGIHSPNAEEKKEIIKTLKKYILNNMKNINTEKYKDLLFIEYRRKGTNHENDKGFDPFPTELFT